LNFRYKKEAAREQAKRSFVVIFSRSFIVQMLLVVVVVPLRRPDLCEASERASENWGKQKSNRRAAAVDLRMGPAASPASLTPFD